MQRVTLRQFASAARLIREPVLLVYAYPRNDPHYGEEIELGVYLPVGAEAREVIGVISIAAGVSPERAAEVRDLFYAALAEQEEQP